MSYRTYVNNIQIFGNDESFKEWFLFLESQGIEIDEEGHYDGYISDFMSGLQCIESIVLNMEKERQEKMKKNDKFAHSLFDLTNIYQNVLQTLNSDSKYETSLFDEISLFMENGYIFIPYQFYNACKDLLEKEKTFSTDKHFYCYKLKPDKLIHVKAY